MLKNFNIPIKGIDGVDLVEPTNENGTIVNKPVTLADIALKALQMSLRGDDELSGTARVGLVDLALRIHAAQGDTELNLDEAATLKERVRKLPGLNHVVFYRLNELLESK